MTVSPALFGLQHANRDFSKPEGWSKNNFNTAFPVALLCYMHVAALSTVYIVANSSATQHESLPVETLMRQNPLAPTTYYAFESDFVPYRPYVVGHLPRSDVVVMNQASGICHSAFEIKLTALPDNATAALPDQQQSCELVIRPDTIVQLAITLLHAYPQQRVALSDSVLSVSQRIAVWDDETILENLPLLVSLAQELVATRIAFQTPFMLQPIWKTEGKKSRLNQHAFDVFVWSDVAFIRLLVKAVAREKSRISRPVRALVWLIKLLESYCLQGRIDYLSVLDEFTLSTKNDKAFSANGLATHPFLASQQLTQPRIERDALRHIILGGGQHLLSPERRLDAVIANMPELFDS